MSKENFSTREWVFVLIIASLIQGVIWYISFENSSSGSALTYVSFAGTLISIILAVLAIGYTYGESVSQKNKTDTVSTQISVLNEVVKSIKVESQSLEHISTISDELTRFASTFEEKMTSTESSVTQVSSSLEAFLNEYDIYDKNNRQQPIETEINKNDLASLLMSFRSPLMEISLLFIVVSRNKKYRYTNDIVEENAIKYIDRAREEMTGEDQSFFGPETNELFTGSFLTLLNVLKGLGLIYEKDDQIVFTDEILKTIKETTISNPQYSGEFYKKIREEVLKDIDV
jgi:hypothetical protein